MSKLCRQCGQVISNELLKQKAKQKSDRIKEARNIAKKNGETCGALRKYNRSHIMSLVLQGMSYREVSKEIGCSIHVIFSTVKEFKLKDKANE